MAISTNINQQVSGWFKIPSFGRFIYSLIQVALAFGAIATLIWFLWGGIEYIVSEGDQERIKTAKNKISHAVIGLVILATTWVIWRLILYFLGFTTGTGGRINLPIIGPGEH